MYSIIHKCTEYSYKTSYTQVLCIRDQLHVFGFTFLLIIRHNQRKVHSGIVTVGATGQPQSVIKCIVPLFISYMLPHLSDVRVNGL